MKLSQLRTWAALPLSLMLWTACGDDTSSNEAGETDTETEGMGTQGEGDTQSSADETTGMAEESTAAEVDTGPADSTTSADGTTTGGMGEPYEACDVTDPDACGDGAKCIGGGCMATGCAEDADCANPTSGDAPATCFDLDQDEVNECFLSCSEGETCPDGMECFADFGFCVYPVEDWDCFPDFYGTGDGCDCGCGTVDPDCAAEDVAACEYCDNAGSCSQSACEGNIEIDPTDNASCIPTVDGWTCSGAFYDDDEDICHCGCGIPDPDCADAGVEACEVCEVNGSCSQGVVCSDLLDPADPTACLWNCDPAVYGADDGCNCGCGLVDADCADATVDSCETCNNAGSCTEFECAGDIDPADSSTCLEPIEGWTCPVPLFDDGETCHCGCGIPDPDCEAAGLGSCDVCDAQGSCSGDNACPGLINADDASTCDWTCDPAYYGTGDGCDCGCGLVDPDCADEDIATCEWCNNEGSCSDFACEGDIDPDDVSSCLEAPEGWTCLASLYGDDTCHCGCGIQDADCETGEIGECEACDGVGSCNGDLACPGVLNEDDPAVCDWTCNPAFYGADDGCDCGCGIVDPDCADATEASCEYCGLPGSCSEGVEECTPIADDDNATCEPV